MRPWMDRATLRGRLHGRLLLALIVVAALASAVALWQFSTLWDDEDPSFASIEGRTTVTVPDAAGEPDSPVASASTTPSPAVASSAAAEDRTTQAAAPSEPAVTTEAAASGPACTASLTLDSEAGDAVSVIVTVANSGAESISGWEVLIGIRNLSVTSTWGLYHIEGERYGDVLFNGALDPGDSTEPSFNADVEGEFRLPATVPCAPTG
ncbi:MAG TPA: cellulose binding domain-containing protein [Glycomyces sp.]|nr:cellulose binding domain-containing protein [Glycomyces sp.]